MDSLFGTVDFTKLSQNKEDWITCYRKLKEELGKNGYTMERYTSILLQAFHDTLGWSDSQYGSTEAMRIMSLCSKITERIEEAEDKQHWYYERAKEYIYSHPLPYQDSETRGQIYFCHLFDEWIKFEFERYEIKQQRKFREVDSTNFEFMEKQIAILLPCEDEIIDFKKLTYATFKFVKSNQWFLESAYNELVDCLNNKDWETGRKIFELL